jgi:hypothetical protein
MARFILRYRGKGPIPGDVVERVMAAPRVNVLDRSAGRMLLVEAPGEDELRDLLDSADQWAISREQTMRLPKSHPNLDESGPNSSQ